MKKSQFIVLILLLILLAVVSFYSGYQLGSGHLDTCISLANQYKNISEQALHGWNETLQSWANCEVSKLQGDIKK